MNNSVDNQLGLLLNAGLQSALCSGLIGLEKETLRVSPAGTMSPRPHPPALGSALTHPYITTDYSEALLEFITPPYPDLRDAHRFLLDIERFVYDRLDNEILWATSMPCVLAGETSIPIARYGDSNPGLMKNIYRRGLGNRYGRVMQVIAGVHFNYSLPDAFWQAWRQMHADTRDERVIRDEVYFRLIRNLLRYGWLMPYLFGSSPAVCKTFLIGKHRQLQDFDANTAFEPYATSLRLSDIGYQNRKESKAGVRASYNCLDDYVDKLSEAISTPYPEYEKIGVCVDGDWRQLNANLLQIENEYYASVRPKPSMPPEGGEEKPTTALRRRGVQYVELRSLDVCAFEPAGVNSEQLHFLEAFMLFCALRDSPPFDDAAREEVNHNLNTVAIRGREPELRLRRDGAEVGLQDWGRQICTQLRGICEVLDGHRGQADYTMALATQQARIDDPQATPSAQVLREMRERGESFYEFALRVSRQHHRFFDELPLSADLVERFEAHAKESLARQRVIEAAAKVPFEQYLREYFAKA